MSADDQQQFGLLRGLILRIKQSPSPLPRVPVSMLEMPPLFAQGIHSVSTRTWPGVNTQLALPVPQSTPVRVCPTAPAQPPTELLPKGSARSQPCSLQSTKCRMRLPRPSRGWGHHKGFVLPGAWGQQQRAGTRTGEGFGAAGAGSGGSSSRKHRANVLRGTCASLLHTERPEPGLGEGKGPQPQRAGAKEGFGSLLACGRAICSS